MTDKARKEIKELARRYAAYGITFEELEKLMDTRPAEISESAGIAGIKMILSAEYGINEYCDMQTACEITGLTEDEILSEMDKIGGEVITGVHFGTTPPES